MDVTTANRIASQMVGELEKVFLGQRDVVEQAVTAVLAGGHALLEGVPGTGKTLLVKALSCITGTAFRRIQFTPDLMPSDVVGVNVFDMSQRRFEFRPGPIFCDLFLADEINRSPAKTQAALLESMEELQATVDGVTHRMSPVFTVFATQNPVEFEGTYPLPEAQVDRFLLKILVDYPAEEAEIRILDNVEGGFDAHHLSRVPFTQVVDRATLEQIRAAARGIHAAPPVRQYVARIVRQTRSYPQMTLGASPRASVMLLLAAKARALLAGREYVTPDDVKSIAPAVLRHRVLLMPEAEIEGQTPDACIRQILGQVEVPR